MRILVVRFSSIGDIVLTTPVFRLLKSRFPEAEIHWLSKEKFMGVLDGNPYIDLTWKWDSLEDRNRLKNIYFDYIIDLQNNTRSQQVKWSFLGTPNTTVTKQNFKKFLWVLLKQGRLRSSPRLAKIFECRSFTERCVDTLKVFGIQNDHLGLDYHIGNEIIETTKNQLGNLQDFICISMGGSFSTKRVPVEKWRDLILKRNKNIVLVGGPSDIDSSKKLEDIISDYNMPIRLINLVGGINLKESAAVIGLSDEVYTGDTGILHISAALGKKVHLIWGNTIPEFGMVPPLKNGGEILQNEVVGLSCRPCTKLGFDSCPKGHFNCMNNLQI